MGPPYANVPRKYNFIPNSPIIPHKSPPHKKNFFPPGREYGILRGGDNMDRNNIEKIAKNSEDRLLLAKLWDKIDAGMRKNIPASTPFLSPRELELARFLFGTPEGLHEFGGYEEAERKMLVYLPEYLEKGELMGPDSPVSCLRATFYQGGQPQPPGFPGGADGSGADPGEPGGHLRGRGKL